MTNSFQPYITQEASKAIDNASEQCFQNRIQSEPVYECFAATPRLPTSNFYGPKPSIDALLKPQSNIQPPNIQALFRPIETQPKECNNLHVSATDFQTTVSEPTSPFTELTPNTKSALGLFEFSNPNNLENAPRYFVKATPGFIYNLEALALMFQVSPEEILKYNPDFNRIYQQGTLYIPLHEKFLTDKKAELKNVTFASTLDWTFENLDTSLLPNPFLASTTLLGVGGFSLPLNVDGLTIEPNAAQPLTFYTQTNTLSTVPITSDTDFSNAWYLIPGGGGASGLAATLSTLGLARVVGVPLLRRLAPQLLIAGARAMPKKGMAGFLIHLIRSYTELKAGTQAAVQLLAIGFDHSDESANALKLLIENPDDYVSKLENELSHLSLEEAAAVGIAFAASVALLRYAPSQLKERGIAFTQTNLASLETGLETIVDFIFRLGMVETGFEAASLSPISSDSPEIRDEFVHTLTFSGLLAIFPNASRLVGNLGSVLGFGATNFERAGQILCLSDDVVVPVDWFTQVLFGTNSSPTLDIEQTLSDSTPKIHLDFENGYDLDQNTDILVITGSTAPTQNRSLKTPIKQEITLVKSTSAASEDFTKTEPHNPTEEILATKKSPAVVAALQNQETKINIWRPFKPHLKRQLKKETSNSNEITLNWQGPTLSPKKEKRLEQNIETLKRRFNFSLKISS